MNQKKTNQNSHKFQGKEETTTKKQVASNSDAGKVSSLAFQELVEESFRSHRAGARLQRRHRERLVGITLHLGLQQQAESGLDHDRLREEASRRIRRETMKTPLSELILWIVIGKIVEIVLEWLLNNKKRTRLLTVDADDAFSLPELATSSGSEIETVR